MVQSDLEAPVVGYTEVLLCSFPTQMALIKENITTYLLWKESTFMLIISIGLSMLQ